MKNSTSLLSQLPNMPSDISIPSFASSSHIPYSVIDSHHDALTAPVLPPHYAILVIMTGNTIYEEG
jgi:hypothetical protein